MPKVKFLTMKRNIIILLSAFVALFLNAEIKFSGTCDKDALSYKCGENMVFTLYAEDTEDPGREINVKWEIWGDDGKAITKGETVMKKGEPFVLETSLDTPGFARARLFAVDSEGKQLYTKKGRKICYEGGAGADIAKIRSSKKEPVDFDAFWAKQVKELKALPLKVDSKKVEDPEFDVYDISVDTIGTPAKAWLSIPKNAAEKSLPLKVFFYGYGVGKINPPKYKDAIALGVERHTYELGQPKEYYQKLAKGKLDKFGLKAEDLKDKEKVYYKFMILRDLKALEYAKTLPQWDGKNISVNGGSMGGFQSIFVAMLDKDVSECNPHIPWMTDLWASVDTPRSPSRFAPEWTPDMRYFDCSFAIKRVKCPVKITAWLGDYCCPPAGVVATFNNAPKGTHLVFGQNGEHNGGDVYKAEYRYEKRK